MTSALAAWRELSSNDAEALCDFFQISPHTLNERIELEGDKLLYVGQCLLPVVILDLLPEAPLSRVQELLAHMNGEVLLPLFLGSLFGMPSRIASGEPDDDQHRGAGGGYGYDDSDQLLRQASPSPQKPRRGQGGGVTECGGGHLSAGDDERVQKAGQQQRQGNNNDDDDDDDDDNNNNRNNNPEEQQQEQVIEAEHPQDAPVSPVVVSAVGDGDGDGDASAGAGAGAGTGGPSQFQQQLHALFLTCLALSSQEDAERMASFFAFAADSVSSTRRVCQIALAWMHDSERSPLHRSGLLVAARGASPGGNNDDGAAPSKVDVANKIQAAIASQAPATVLLADATLPVNVAVILSVPIANFCILQHIDRDPELIAISNIRDVISAARESGRVRDRRAPSQQQDNSNDGSGGGGGDGHRGGNRGSGGGGNGSHSRRMRHQQQNHYQQQHQQYQQHRAHQHHQAPPPPQYIVIENPQHQHHHHHSHHHHAAYPHHYQQHHQHYSHHHQMAFSHHHHHFPMHHHQHHQHQYFHHQQHSNLIRSPSGGPIYTARGTAGGGGGGGGGGAPPPPYQQQVSSRSQRQNRSSPYYHQQQQHQQQAMSDDVNENENENEIHFSNDSNQSSAIDSRDDSASGRAHLGPPPPAEAGAGAAAAAAGAGGDNAGFLSPSDFNEYVSRRASPPTLRDYPPVQLSYCTRNGQMRHFNAYLCCGATVSYNCSCRRQAPRPLAAHHTGSLSLTRVTRTQAMSGKQEIAVWSCCGKEASRTNLSPLGYEIVPEEKNGCVLIS